MQSSFYLFIEFLIVPCLSYQCVTHTHAAFECERIYNRLTNSHVKKIKLYEHHEKQINEMEMKMHCAFYYQYDNDQIHSILVNGAD